MNSYCKMWHDPTSGPLAPKPKQRALKGRPVVKSRHFSGEDEVVISFAREEDGKQITIHLTRTDAQFLNHQLNLFYGQNT